MPTPSGHSSLSSTSPTLLQRVRNGDAEAWRRLTDLYGPLVFHWCRRQGVGEHDAADLTQDVFASVARAVRSFEQRSTGTFRGWLWTITRNRLRDFFRRRATEAAAAGGTAAWQQLAAVAESLSDNPDEYTDKAQLTALHRRGIELVRCQFEERTWQLFWQTVVEERPTSEVASEFEISANAVRQARSRVLRRLRQELGDVPE
ncbi:sigma-70 family RNA polymerase sigma factor [bacterium]|nr:sigma-70 family RNA polymerase sigma factor [bacterium]